IDIGLGFANKGVNNAFIRTSSCTWNAVTQDIPVRPHTDYRLQASIRTSNGEHEGLAKVDTVFMGVRPGGSLIPQDQAPQFGPSRTGIYEPVSVAFNSRENNTMTVFVGFWGKCPYDGWIQIDTVFVLSS